jgi:hypothetical protein
MATYHLRKKEDEDFRIVRYEDGRMHFNPCYLNKNGLFQRIIERPYDTYNSRRYAIAFFKKCLPNEVLRDETARKTKLIK